MTGHLGFSYVGLIYLLMLFIPNIIWAKNKPQGYDEISKKENKILLIFERTGQVCITICALIFKDFNISFFNLWSLWLLVFFILMLIYEICWIRYFIKPELKNFYGSFLGIPVPLASLPVLAFLLLGIYGKVIWLIISAVLIGIGHIGIHIQNLKAVNNSTKAREDIKF